MNLGTSDLLRAIANDRQFAGKSDASCRRVASVRAEATALLGLRIGHPYAVERSANLASDHPHNDKHSDLPEMSRRVSNQRLFAHGQTSRSDRLLCNPATDVLSPPHGDPRRELHRLGESPRLNAPPQRGLGDGHERQYMRLSQEARFRQRKRALG